MAKRVRFLTIVTATALVATRVATAGSVIQTQLCGIDSVWLQVTISSFDPIPGIDEGDLSREVTSILAARIEGAGLKLDPSASQGVYVVFRHAWNPLRPNAVAIALKSGISAEVTRDCKKSLDCERQIDAKIWTDDWLVLSTVDGARGEMLAMAKGSATHLENDIRQARQYCAENSPSHEGN